MLQDQCDGFEVVDFLQFFKLDTQPMFMIEFGTPWTLTYWISVPQTLA